jgi:uncharacterized membrane-anchored protein
VSDPAPTDSRRRAAQRMAVKVPEITVYFWVIKVLTTAMGEATSDFLVHYFPRAVAVVLGALGLGVALLLQFLAHRYVIWIYWLAVSMVAVFGTMAADALHIGLGIPYLVSSIVFAVALAVIFATWYRTERTLSIHSIYTRRRELFYWSTVLATFALGTAAGDTTAKTLSLGYLGSGVMFAVVIVVPALAWWRFGLNAIAAFWFAYVITRPLGASFADWMDVTKKAGGLGLGRGSVALALTAAIVVLVGFVAVSRRDVPSDRATPAIALGCPAPDEL